MTDVNLIKINLLQLSDTVRTKEILATSADKRVDNNMQIAQQLQDRRGNVLHHDEHWSSMSAEQKMALYSLHRYGYRLLFVRHLPSGPLAIIAQQNQLSTIDRYGEVEHEPKIQLRD